MRVVDVVVPVLSELLDDDLIYLFRGEAGDSPNEERRLTLHEAREELYADWWKTLPIDRADVLIAPTQSGEVLGRSMTADAALFRSAD